MMMLLAVVAAVSIGICSRLILQLMPSLCFDSAVGFELLKR
jgi:hypothetical protein